MEDTGWMRCFRCRGPSTAGPHPMYPDRGMCIRCASVTTIEIPQTPERMARPPREIVEGPAWRIAQPFARNGEIWLHQANALDQLNQGRNVVISTSTASGKSLAFQIQTFHETSTIPGATAIIFYPTKALGNDQTRRWREQAAQLGLPPGAVGQIDGDVPTPGRNRILDEAQVLIMTPDSCHAWLVPRANTSPTKEFLRNLRIIIIDEAHSYEGVLGSNSAYFARRLISAARMAGNENNLRVIAATATILHPEQHMEKLTGMPFVTIGEDQNGTPRFPRTLHHLAMGREGTRETQMAQLITSIIDADPTAQVIAFHDSRQGVENIAQLVDRPDSVLPYRAGYLPQDRKEIEDRLRANEIRAVIATSALELGIDMPDLNFGINLDIPGTRKQFHQRLGRVGRSREGAFIILADQHRFRNYGETLQQYYDNSVEPSHLYLDNEYISFQQAQCLKDEMARFGEDTMVAPVHCQWPETFETALRNTHGRIPQHLVNLHNKVRNKRPLLRSTGEENMDIENAAGNKIGDISVSQALREAYPGAIYYHQTRTYRIEEWKRKQDTRAPYIRATPLRPTSERTKPLLRQMAVLDPSPENIIENHHSVKRRGQVTELRLHITESTEGFESSIEGTLFYRNLMKKDPRRSRKQQDFPTTGLHIQIDERWFSGAEGAAWQAKQQIARTLQDHLAYNKSIASRELGGIIDNIIIKNPRGYLFSRSSIIIYDRIYGGLDLVRDIYDNLQRYAERIRDGAKGDHRASFQTNSQRFLNWVKNDQMDFLDEIDLPEPGRNDWWRVIRKGSTVKVFSPGQGEPVTGQVTGIRWEDGIRYTVEAQGETITAEDDQLSPAGWQNFDWQFWRPLTNAFEEMSTGT